MFVNPKITLTPRVADPATVVRKARILLDHQLRQDAAYNRPVSRVNYRIGDVSCQITHEFGQTYIALDQVVTTAVQPAKRPQPYQFLTVVTVASDTTDTPTSAAAWVSRDGYGWDQLPVSPFMATLFCEGNWSDVIWGATRVSQYNIFVITRTTPGVYGWSLFGLNSFSQTAVTAFPSIPNQGVIVGVTSLTYVGGTTICMVVDANSITLAVWFDWITQEFIYVLPLAALGIVAAGTTSYKITGVNLTPLTRSAGENYASVAMAIQTSTGINVWTINANTATWVWFGSLPLPSGQNSYNLLAPYMQSGASGSIAMWINASTSSTTSFTELYTLTPQTSSNYLSGQYPYTFDVLIYSPLGWAFPAQSISQGLTFVTPAGQVSTALAPRQMPAYVSCPVNTPNGVFDMAAGVVYQAASETGMALPLPPYADPQNPNYVLNQPYVEVTGYYLGPGLFPELNLY